MILPGNPRAVPPCSILSLPVNHLRGTAAVGQPTSKAEPEAQAAFKFEAHHGNEFRIRRSFVALFAGGDGSTHSSYGGGRSMLFATRRR